MPRTCSTILVTAGCAIAVGSPSSATASVLGGDITVERPTVTSAEVTNDHKIEPSARRTRGANGEISGTYQLTFTARVTCEYPTVWEEEEISCGDRLQIKSLQLIRNGRTTPIRAEIDVDGEWQGSRSTVTITVPPLRCRGNQRLSAEYQLAIGQTGSDVPLAQQTVRVPGSRCTSRRTKISSTRSARQIAKRAVRSDFDTTFGQYRCRSRQNRAYYDCLWQINRGSLGVWNCRSFKVGAITGTVFGRRVNYWVSTPVPKIAQVTRTAQQCRY